MVDSVSRESLISAKIQKKRIRDGPTGTQVDNRPTISSSVSRGVRGRLVEPNILNKVYRRNECEAQIRQALQIPLIIPSIYLTIVDSIPNTLVVISVLWALEKTSVRTELFHLARKKSLSHNPPMRVSRKPNPKSYHTALENNFLHQAVSSSAKNNSPRLSQSAYHHDNAL